MIGVNIDQLLRLIHTVMIIGIRMNVPMMISVGLRNSADQSPWLRRRRRGSEGRGGLVAKPSPVCSSVVT